MFVLKKILTPFILPPGIFIVLLIIIGVLSIYKNRKIIGSIITLLGLLMWLLSITPVSYLFLRGLESEFSIPKNPEADVIILLGGGIREKVNDLSGEGFPNGDMLGRVITAVRLQKKLNVPIIIASGKVFDPNIAGAIIVKRILVDLGIAESQIIIEDKSRDTYENAKFSQAICLKMGFSRPILLTSAFHLKRSLIIFDKIGLKTIPFPAYSKTRKNQEYIWQSLLPEAKNFSNVSIALHEYLGLLYYKIFY